MAFKINFSDEDKASEARSAVFDAVPTGDYPCYVTDVELAQVKNGNNKGKDMFKVTLTVDDEDSEYNNRKFWPNVMLFEIEGGNWFLAQFLKATGNADALETGNVPDADAYIGKKLIANVRRMQDKYEWKSGDPVKYKNEVKGFMPFGDGSKATTSKGKKSNSLLPGPDRKSVV